MISDSESDLDSDPFPQFKTQEEVILYYYKRLKEIEAVAKREYGIETDEFAEMFRNEFLRDQLCTTPIPAATQSSKRFGKHEFSQLQYFIVCFIKYVYSQLRRYMVHIAILALVFALVNYRVELTRIFMRHFQVYIYPFMRFWRKLTMPIIQRFPELTRFYDETCLVSNPFFRVANLDCTPCTDVINVVDLSIAPHFDYLGSNIPYIIQQADGINKSIARIYQVYLENCEMFRRDAYRITSTDSNIANLDQLFDVMLNKSGKSDTNNIHNLWRINRMFPGIALRALFPAPKTLPEHAGIDIERYIAFDINGGTTYQLPSTDCSNMFVYQAIGSRIIHLKPTVECKDQCRRITVKLKENYTLFYDWWYWKPISSPVHQLTRTTSVSYIGSYCI